jgi:hypothetical protein
VVYIEELSIGHSPNKSKIKMKIKSMKRSKSKIRSKRRTRAVVAGESYS